MNYMKVQWKFIEVNVSPEKAKELLATSKGNRGISQRVVHRYARNMRLGYWDTAGDGVFITMYDNSLIDAHHRMYAIMEANVTIPMIIRIPDRKPICFDLNKVRSTKDIIDLDNGIHGHPANTKVITIVRFIWEHIFSIKKADRATDFDVKDYYEDNDEILTKASRISEYTLKGQKGLLRNGMCGAALYGAMRYGIESETLEKFSRIVSTGLYDNENETAAIALRNYIIAMDNTKLKLVGGPQYRKVLCGLTQRAIMDFANGVKRGKPYTVGDAIYKYTDFVREKDENRYILHETKIENLTSGDVETITTHKHLKFIPPTVEEVRAYCNQRNNHVDAEKFVAYYTSNGWMVGKNKMKDWKAAVITWEKNSKEKKWA